MSTRLREESDLTRFYALFLSRSSRGICST